MSETAEKIGQAIPELRYTPNVLGSAAAHFGPGALEPSSRIAASSVCWNSSAWSCSVAGATHRPSASLSNRRRFFRDGVELSAEELPLKVAAATGEDGKDEELDPGVIQLRDESSGEVLAEAVVGPVEGVGR